MIFHLDADMNGVDSIQRLIKAGVVVHMPCPSFEEFEKNTIELLKGVGPQDQVVLDTVGAMLNTTRGDAKLGNKFTESQWETAKAKYLAGDKNYLTVYEMAGQLVLRRIKNLRARGARIWVVAHEDEMIDPTDNTKKHAPQVNPAFLDSLLGASSDVFRLREVANDIINQTSGEVVLKAGSRILYLRRSDDYIAKFHVDRERSAKIPRYIINPTTTALYDVLGKEPSFCTLYGHPGAGKTTLAVGDAERALEATTTPAAKKPPAAAASK